MRVEEIKDKIEQGISGCEVFVDGDGRHFQVIVVSDAFSGKNMVQQHQLVYQTLGDKVGGDELHALSISTYTNEEWQRQKKIQGIK
ncbi:MAG: BolA/IbaG family iron-sulfur metabolism protein [Proteobacteria bacterium]|nr:BolA/IbaG family iron-sulfur metabolism protein [Pseudomonadota bacterium]